jgi:hypothetical protein
MSKPKLGSGARFKALESKLASRPGVTNPAALAASIGRVKYGSEKMAKLSAGGKKGK